MNLTEERLEFTAESASERGRIWKLPALYTVEISSCCAYLVFIVFAFVTASAVMESSIKNDSLHEAQVFLTPNDYAVSVYSLLVIVCLGVVIGYLTQLCRLPSLLGMLVVGIALRNTPEIGGSLFVVKEWSVVLRRVAFIVILLRGGLSLDAGAIRRLKGACLRLSLIPCTVEIIVVAVMAKLVFGMDFIFGVLLGAVLGAVSPAVVIPALLDASKAGYGVRAGVPSLVIAAASLDDVYAITVFSLAVSLLFPSGSSRLMTILAAPAEVFAGIFFGSAMGFLLHVLPRNEVKNVHLIRLSVLFTFSTAILFTTIRLNVDGAGAIAVLVSAFVAGHAWKKEGPLPEEDHLANLWHLAFQPLLFGLIGFELSFEMVRSDTVLCGCLLLVLGLLFRFFASFLAVFGTSFTTRERLFVAVAWMPKATVQAALAPVVMDMARSKSGVEPSYVDNGIVIFTIAVLSILITAPVGAFLIRLATPVLLTKDGNSPKEVVLLAKSETSTKQATGDVDETTTHEIMYKLICAVQTYDWGKKGNQSAVAALVKEGHHASYVDDNKPYAEFWMGVHKNGPAKLVDTSEYLSTRIENHPEVVGKHEQGTLQFLFKVLSVGKSLSVQSHPTKEEAALLHAKDPAHYPDPNHKPEMAIALTNFELLCGFRPPREIYENLKGCPEILELIANCENLERLLDSNEAVAKQTLKNVFTKVWSSSPEAIAKALQAFVARISKDFVSDPKNTLDELIIRLDKEYPGGDVGVFAPLLLNHFTLKPGEATFLGPNQPHAYLSGDCVECMACSDNTIRAGLTPKFKDIKTLCANLTYAMSGPPLFPHKDLSPGVRLYAPPVPEFAVQAIEAKATKFTTESASSIVIVINGSACFKAGSLDLHVHRGDVIFFSAACSDVHIVNPTSDFISYRAYTPRP
ncbi:hypothetical protein GCK32_007395 [Trichostrongylus colubriformis]|uniref:mannose-6-phosphate isomerase n=1 Tax=Trichostrongylus colubriformis TaxID=6319 RepID=A0AAN8IDU6_TRICO